MEKLYELHRATSRLRPDRRRHPAHPQRPRLPRCAPSAHPVPRPPPLPAADRHQPGRAQGRQHGRPVLRPHGGQGRGRRRDRRRHRLLPGLRRHGAGVQGAGRRRSRRCSGPTTPRSCWSPSPRRDTIAEATFFAEKLAEGGIAVRGPDRQPHAPQLRRRARRGDARAGQLPRGPRHRRPLPQPGRLPAGGAHARRSTSAGLADTVAPGAGGAGAVPALRRARPRRAAPAIEAAPGRRRLRPTRTCRSVGRRRGRA